MSWSKRILTYAVSVSLVLGVVPSLAHATEDTAPAPDSISRVGDNATQITVTKKTKIGICEFAKPLFENPPVPGSPSEVLNQPKPDLYNKYKFDTSKGDVPSFVDWYSTPSWWTSNRDDNNTSDPINNIRSKAGLDSAYYVRSCNDLRLIPKDDSQVSTGTIHWTTDAAPDPNDIWNSYTWFNTHYALPVPGWDGVRVVFTYDADGGIDKVIKLENRIHPYQPDPQRPNQFVKQLTQKYTSASTVNLTVYVDDNNKVLDLKNGGTYSPDADGQTFGWLQVRYPSNLKEGSYPGSLTEKGDLFSPQLSWNRADDLTQYTEKRCNISKEKVLISDNPGVYSCVTLGVPYRVLRSQFPIGSTVSDVTVSSNSVTIEKNFTFYLDTALGKKELTIPYRIEVRKAEVTDRWSEPYYSSLSSLTNRLGTYSTVRNHILSNLTEGSLFGFSVDLATDYSEHVRTVNGKATTEFFSVGVKDLKVSFAKTKEGDALDLSPSDYTVKFTPSRGVASVACESAPNKVFTPDAEGVISLPYCSSIIINPTPEASRVGDSSKERKGSLATKILVVSNEPVHEGKQLFVKVNVNGTVEYRDGEDATKLLTVTSRDEIEPTQVELKTLAAQGVSLPHELQTPNHISLRHDLEKDWGSAELPLIKYSPKATFSGFEQVSLLEDRIEDTWDKGLRTASHLYTKSVRISSRILPLNALEECNGRVVEYKNTSWCATPEGQWSKVSLSAPESFKSISAVLIRNPQDYMYWDSVGEGANKVKYSPDLFQPDVFDLDEDGDTSERNVMYLMANASINPPNEAIAYFQVSLNDGPYGGSATFKNGDTVSYRLNVDNFASSPLSFDSVSSKLPSTDDNHTYNISDIIGSSSDFNIRLKSRPVLQGNLRALFSTDGTNFVPDTDITDWSKVVSFRLDVPNHELAPNSRNSITLPVSLPEGARGVAVSEAEATINGHTSTTGRIYLHSESYCVPVVPSYVGNASFAWPLKLVDQDGVVRNTLTPTADDTAVNICTFHPGTYHIEADVPSGLAAPEGSDFNAETKKSTTFEIGDNIVPSELHITLQDPSYDKVVPFGETLEITRPAGYSFAGPSQEPTTNEDGSKWVFHNTCEVQDSFDATVYGSSSEPYHTLEIPFKVTPAPHQDKDCASFQPTSTVSATQGTSTETQLVADDPSKIESVTYAVDGQSWVTTQDGKAVVAPGFDVAPGDYTIKATVTYKDGSTSESTIPVKVVAAPVSVSKLTVKQGQSASQDINVPGSPTLSLAEGTDAAFTVDGNTLVAAPTCSTAPGGTKVVVNATYASTGYVRAVEVPVTIIAASQAECAHIATDLPEVGARQGEEVSTDFPVGADDEVSTNVPWVRYEDGKLIVAPGYDVKPGTYPVVVTVKHPDGSTSVSTLPVKVDGVSYTLPEGTSVEVRQGETEELPLDLPDGASLATVQPGWVTIDGNKLVFQPVCGTPVGGVETTVGIVYADGRKGNVVVPTKVLAAPQADCTDPVAPVDLVLTQGKRTEVDLKVPAGATVSLPEGTPEWVKVEGNKMVITPPEDLAPGHYTFTADVTYEDGSKDTVSFKAYVEKLTKVVEIPEIPEPQPPVTTIVPPAPSAPSVKVESEGSSPWNWLWVIPAVLGLATVVSYWQYINQVDGGDRYPLVRGQANPADWIRWIQGLPARESGGLR